MLGMIFDNNKDAVLYSSKTIPYKQRMATFCAPAQVGSVIQCLFYDRTTRLRLHTICSVRCSGGAQCVAIRTKNDSGLEFLLVHVFVNVVSCRLLPDIPRKSKDAVVVVSDTGPICLSNWLLSRIREDV